MQNLNTAAPTRRLLLAGGLAGIVTAVARRALAQAQPPPEQKSPTPARAALTALHYQIDFKAPPKRIYGLLLDAKQFADMTGMAASVDAAPGAAFTLFNKMIEGRNVELIEGRRIVQAWRPASWEQGVYSIAHFEIKARGEESTLVFDHTGFPAGLADHLDIGWRGHYWEPMQKYLAAS